MADKFNHMFLITNVFYLQTKISTKRTMRFGFVFKVLKIRQFFNQRRLESGVHKVLEIGRFQPENHLYSPGQLFIHKVLAYRGMILFPWAVRLLDNISVGVAKNKELLETLGEKSTEEAGKKVLYYQVLIDAQDRTFISNFMSNEGVSFLGNADSNYKIQVISGLDHVSHEDILPYTETQSSFRHELLNSFFQHRPGKEPCFVARESLKAWQLKNSPWLKMTQVYRERTEDVRVTVIPFFIGYHKSKRQKVVYWWRYWVRLENLGQFNIQLRAHQWRIFSQFGLLDIAKGMGVVGQEPFLCKRYPCFQYCSHVSLPTSGGHMWGTYLIDRENGSSFECRIPLFLLESDKVNPPDTTTTSTTHNTTF